MFQIQNKYFVEELLYSISLIWNVELFADLVPENKIFLRIHKIKFIFKITSFKEERIWYFSVLHVHQPLLDNLRKKYALDFSD